MLRFQTDRWSEALLRPFVLADPNSGIYFELPAPDLRFGLLVLAALVLLLARRGRRKLAPGARRLLASLLVMFVVWTVVIGNGRYFIAGLLLTGVLLTAVIVALPGTRLLRGTLLALTLALQSSLVYQHFDPGQWALARWSGPGPGLPAAQGAPWPEQPAVFITVTGITFSMLAPQAHPQSRWVSIAGQVEMGPRLPEYARFVALLADPLPKYLVLPTMPERVLPGMQPSAARTVLADEALSRHGLQRQPAPCTLLPSRLVGTRPHSDANDPAPIALGFWLCPLQAGPVAPAAAARQQMPPQSVAAVAALEQRCPRLFPPRAVNVTQNAKMWLRNYPASDVKLYVEADGAVYLRYLRALNPTAIGSTADVAAGRFTLDCHALPGRYQFPWERE